MNTILLAILCFVNTVPRTQCLNQDELFNRVKQLIKRRNVNDDTSEQVYLDVHNMKPSNPAHNLINHNSDMLKSAAHYPQVYNVQNSVYGNPAHYGIQNRHHETKVYSNFRKQNIIKNVLDYIIRTVANANLNKTKTNNVNLRRSETVSDFDDIVYENVADYDNENSNDDIGSAENDEDVQDTDRNNQPLHDGISPDYLDDSGNDDRGDDYTDRGDSNHDDTNESASDEETHESDEEEQSDHSIDNDEQNNDADSDTVEGLDNRDTDAQNDDSNDDDYAEDTEEDGDEQPEDNDSDNNVSDDKKAEVVTHYDPTRNVYGNPQSFGIQNRMKESTAYTNFRRTISNKNNNFMAEALKLINDALKKVDRDELGRSNTDLLIVGVPDDPNQIGKKKETRWNQKALNQIFKPDNVLSEDSSNESPEIFNTRRRHYYKYGPRRSEEAHDTGTSSSSGEKNPGNPYTVQNERYLQNWLWNFNLDGDHMNLSPKAPVFQSTGPSGTDLFYTRKWWYFHQDDFLPF